MYITAQGPRLRNDYTVSSGTLNSTIPYHTTALTLLVLIGRQEKHLAARIILTFSHKGAPGDRRNRW